MSYFGVHVHYISVSFVDKKRYYTQLISFISYTERKLPNIFSYSVATPMLC